MDEWELTNPSGPYKVCLNFPVRMKPSITINITYVILLIKLRYLGENSFGETVMSLGDCNIGNANATATSEKPVIGMIKCLYHYFEATPYINTHYLTLFRSV